MASPLVPTVFCGMSRRSWPRCAFPCLNLAASSTWLLRRSQNSLYTCSPRCHRRADLKRGSLTGDRGFESISLHRRVCKPSVPLGFEVRSPRARGDSALGGVGGAYETRPLRCQLIASSRRSSPQKISPPTTKLSEPKRPAGALCFSVPKLLDPLAASKVADPLRVLSHFAQAVREVRLGTHFLTELEPAGGKRLGRNRKAPPARARPSG